MTRVSTQHDRLIDLRDPIDIVGPPDVLRTPLKESRVEQAFHTKALDKRNRNRLFDPLFLLGKGRNLSSDIWKILR